MLKGKELGNAIRAAMKLKGVTQNDVAAEFGIKQPSVSEWLRFGRVDKGHVNHLVIYFSDVVAPAHWGLGELFPVESTTSSKGELEKAQKLTLTSSDIVDIYDNLDEPEKQLFERLLLAAGFKLPGVNVEVELWERKDKSSARPLKISLEPHEAKPSKPVKRASK